MWHYYSEKCYLERLFLHSQNQKHLSRLLIKYKNQTKSYNKNLASNLLQIITPYAMATSTVFDFGGGVCFSTVTVRTPFSHLAVIADKFALSGKRNFLSSFWGALLSSLMYLQPSSSPSCRFLFPLLFMASVFSSSIVTCSKTDTFHEHKKLYVCLNNGEFDWITGKKSTWMSDLERPGTSMTNIYSLGASKISTGILEALLLSWFSWSLEGVSWTWFNKLFTTPVKSMSNKVVIKFTLHTLLCLIR